MGAESGPVEKQQKCKKINTNGLIVAGRGSREMTWQMSASEDQDQHSAGSGVLGGAPAFLVAVPVLSHSSPPPRTRSQRQARTAWLRIWTRFPGTLAEPARAGQA